MQLFNFRFQTVNKGKKEERERHGLKERETILYYLCNSRVAEIIYYCLFIS